MTSLQHPHLLKTQAYINGQWVNANNSISVINPATEEVLVEVANLTAKECSQAVEAANTALTAWQTLSAKDRSHYLKHWHQLILNNIEDLSQILTLEQGKPLAEANGEIRYGANYVEWFAEEAKRMDGDIIPAPSLDKQILVTKKGVGVVGGITPWNFPCAMLLRKAAPALAAGCTLVVKPAAETPLSALALAVLAEEAGIPPGVFNIVTSSDAQSIGEVLTTHSKVRKFTFTGSTKTGKHLLTQCAASIKRTSMELGGNAPFIVFDDADIDAAVTGALASKFRNAGQTCVSANRFLIHSNVYDEFIDKLSHEIRSLKLGSGLRAQNQIGPLIHKNAVLRVHHLVHEAIAQGANLVMGGKTSKVGSCFYEPTVLTHITDDMSIFHEEIFGPVVAIRRFESEQEAVMLANKTNMGLAAYFYTNNIRRIFRLSQQLEVGMIGINEGIISNEMAPFGGVKESGFGREGSKYGIADYIEHQYLCLGGL